MQKIEKDNLPDLKELILEGIKQKKGKDIVILDFEKIESAVCQYFIVCHGSSNTQTDAIAGSIEKLVKENVGTRPWHKEGYENSQWILLDYGEAIVHIFQEEYRQHYKLEDLWADAEITRIEDDINE